MENQPLVSVIIVSYNAAEYIIEALESVKSQSYKNIELIVSDDCSKDGTPALVEKWLGENKDSFVRTELITVDNNTGVSANYNRAVRACNGEWVKNVDGDDLIAENCIQSNIDFAKEHPEAKLIFSNVMDFRGSNPKVILGEHISKEHKPFFQLSAEEQFKALLHSNVLPSQSCFVKLSLLRQFPYNEDYRGLEDEPMWLTLTRNGYKAFFFDECTAYYRVGESTIFSNTRYYSPVYVESFFMLYWNEKLKYLKKYNLVKANDLNRRTMLKMDFAIYYLRNKKSRLHNFIYRIVCHYIFNRLTFKF